MRNGKYIWNLLRFPPEAGGETLCRNLTGRFSHFYWWQQSFVEHFAECTCTKASCRIFFLPAPIIKQDDHMHQAALLFFLNIFDAWMTLIWVQRGIADEANHFMRWLMVENGTMSFLVFKISIGLLAALCFYRWGHLPAARLGLRIALGVYLVIFAIHVTIGAMACGVTAWLGF
jgi:hypothetical protein